MTPLQQEKIKNKIKKIKATLAAEKRNWGGYYRDGQGLRYIPPQLYIKLNDFTGGLRYFNWFNKNFPDDCGYPDFLFEWTIILFKTKKLKEAEKKAFETFCNNTYLLDTFLGKNIATIQKWEGSNLETKAFAENIHRYSPTQDNLVDFSKWLEEISTSEKFIRLSNICIDIQKRLLTENDAETRSYLFRYEQQLINEF